MIKINAINASKLGYVYKKNLSMFVLLLYLNVIITILNDILVLFSTYILKWKSY